jgi:predicted transcriptional regulator
MDKIFSTRISTRVLKVIDELAKQLHVSKKKIIEDAIEKYAEEKKDKGFDILTQTSGAWKREETPGEIAAETRQEFTANFKRHKS